VISKNSSSASFSRFV